MSLSLAPYLSPPNISGGVADLGPIVSVEVLGDATYAVPTPANAYPAGLTSATLPLNGSAIRLALNTAIDPSLFSVASNAAIEATSARCAKLVVTVEEQGWDASGNETTWQRTLYGLYPMREPNLGDGATLHQATANSLDIVLNDWLYNADLTGVDSTGRAYRSTIVSVALGAGFITGSAAGTMAGGSVTRSDSRSHLLDRAIGNTLEYPRRRVAGTSGNVFEFTAASKWGFNGQMIACWEAWIEDSGANVSPIVRAGAETKSRFADGTGPSGKAAGVYSCDLTTAKLGGGTLTDGVGYVRSAIKPWIGPAIYSNSADYSDPTVYMKPDFSKGLRVGIDNGVNHVVYCRILGNGTTGRDFSSTAGFFTAAGSGSDAAAQAAAQADTGYTSWQDAWRAFKTSNNGRTGHASGGDVSGLIAFVLGVDQTGGGLGSDVGGLALNNGTTGASSTFNPTNMPMGNVLSEIRAVPTGGDLNTVRLVRKAAATDATVQLPIQSKLKGFKLDSKNSTSAAVYCTSAASAATGPTWTDSTQPILVLEDCVSDGGYSGLSSAGGGLLYMYRHDLLNCPNPNAFLGLWFNNSSSIGPAVVVGSDLVRDGTSGATTAFTCNAPVCLGNRIDGNYAQPYGAAPSGKTTAESTNRQFIVMNNEFAGNSMGWFNNTAARHYYTLGGAIVGNIFKRSDGSSDFMSLHADTQVGEMKNVLIAHNTIPGKEGDQPHYRWNCGYTELDFAFVRCEHIRRYNFFQQSAAKSGEFNTPSTLTTTAPISVGVYSALTTYVPGQFVVTTTTTAGEDVWECISETTGNAPAAGADNTWWKYCGAKKYASAIGPQTNRTGNLMARWGVGWDGEVNCRDASATPDGTAGTPADGSQFWMAERYPRGSSGQAGGDAGVFVAASNQFGYADPANAFADNAGVTPLRVADGSAFTTRGDWTPKVAGTLANMRRPAPSTSGKWGMSAMTKYDLVGRTRVTNAWGPGGAVEFAP